MIRVVSVAVAKEDTNSDFPIGGSPLKSGETIHPKKMIDGVNAAIERVRWRLIGNSQLRRGAPVLREAADTSTFAYKKNVAAPRTRPAAHSLWRSGYLFRSSKRRTLIAMPTIA